MLLTFLRRLARPLKSWPLLLAGTAVLCFTASCDDPNEVGLEVDDALPANAKYVELAFPAATVARRDSLLTANKVQFIAGRLLDASVGLTTASAYLQIQPLSTNPDAALPADGVADSLVLYLPYTSLNGTADERLRLEAYEITEGLRADRAYYGDSPAPALAAARAGWMTVKNRSISTTKRRVPLNPVRTGVLANDTPTQVVFDSARTAMRFLLKESDLPRRLYTAVGTPQNASLAALQEVVKGLAIVPAPTSGDRSEGALVTFDANNNALQLVLYYHLPDATAGTFIWKAGYGTLDRRFFTRLTTDLSAGAALAALATQDSVAAAATGQATYVQGGVELGTRLWLTGVPALRKLKEANGGRLIINRAELVVPIKPLATAVYNIPAQLYLYQGNVLGRLLRLDGAPRTVQITGASPTGNASPETAVFDATQQAYRALITGWLQDYVDGRLPDDLNNPTDDVRSLWLLPSLNTGTALGLNRALLDAAPGRIRLKVYYSTLN